MRGGAKDEVKKRRRLDLGIRRDAWRLQYSSFIYSGCDWPHGNLPLLRYVNIKAREEFYDI